MASPLSAAARRPALPIAAGSRSALVARCDDVSGSSGRAIGIIGIAGGKNCRAGAKGATAAVSVGRTEPVTSAVGVSPPKLRVD